MLYLLLNTQVSYLGLDNAGSKKYVAPSYLITSFSCTFSKMLKKKIGTKLAFQPFLDPLSSEQFVQSIQVPSVSGLASWVTGVGILSYFRIHLFAFEECELLGEFM